MKSLGSRDLSLQNCPACLYKVTCSSFLGRNTCWCEDTRVERPAFSVEVSLLEKSFSAWSPWVEIPDDDEKVRVETPVFSKQSWLLDESLFALSKWAEISALFLELHNYTSRNFCIITISSKTVINCSGCKANVTSNNKPRMRWSGRFACYWVQLPTWVVAVIMYLPMLSISFIQIKPWTNCDLQRCF